MSRKKIPPGFWATFPAAPPPEGVKSNFDHPANHDASLIALNTIFLALTIIVVTMRLYAKGAVMHTLGWDDYTCALAAATSVVHSGVMLSSLQYGFGRHLWDIRAFTLLDVSVVRTIAAPSVVYPFVIYLVKVSILLLYLRTFGVNRLVRQLVYIGLLFLTLFYISYIGVSIAVLIYCVSPVSNVTYDVCKNEYAVLVFQGVFNVCSDFYVFLIPTQCIIRLHVSKGQKIGLLVIFLAGLVTCLVSIARLINLAITFDGPDALWNAALSAEFSIVEINLGIIASCMSTLPGLISNITGSSVFRSIRTFFFSSRGNTTKRSKSTSNTQSNSRGTAPDQPFRSPKSTYIELEDRPRFELQGHRDIDNTSDSIQLREMNAP
ncbi:hypothetical protein ACMFMG_007897 [Clarireedia jacksonii]